MQQNKFIKEPRISHSWVSKYTGVKWNREACLWEAYLTHNKVRYTCGLFDNDRDAAKARDIKIISLGLKKPLQILKAP